MEPSTLKKNYQSRSGISWVVEKNGIRLFKEMTGNSIFLNYPEAALWDLISQGYSYLRAEMVLSRIFSMDPAETQKMMNDSLEYLEKEGFLELEKHG